MQTGYKIAVLGIGGVGGYIGGLLAKGKHPGIDVFFVARGESLNAINSHGLELSTPGGDIVVHPTLTTNNPADIDRIDLLICCIKAYDLEESLLPLSPIIDKYTVIIPFLNGLNISKKIKQILPAADVWEGCIYIASRLIAPGKIRQSGSLKQIIFGSSTATPKLLKHVQNIFEKSGMEVTISKNMNQQVWLKFFFISVLATITSYYNATMGEISNNEERLSMLKGMIKELYIVAATIPVILPADLPKTTFEKIVSLPADSGSSMLSDFRKGGKTEVEELTGDIVRLGSKLNIPTPIYQLMYNGLIKDGKHI